MDKLQELMSAIEAVLTPDRLGYTSFMDCDGDCQGSDCHRKIRSGENHTSNCEIYRLKRAFEELKGA